MGNELDVVYSHYKDLCIAAYKTFSKDRFKKLLTEELVSNSIPADLPVNEAIALASSKHSMSLEQIARYIFDVSKERIYTEDKSFLNGFAFNNSYKSCLAPYSTLNFDTTGVIRFCCYNNKFILGTYPSISIEDAWYNPARKEFIKSLEAHNFNQGCERCEYLIATKNTAGALYTKFNMFEPYIKELPKDLPLNFEFEFGTICNYECIMCGGKWSSSIRKNREKLPPIKSPYDENFIKQLKYFIPYLRTATFLGGEPFLNPLYYKIWDLLLELNKDIILHITTNGSILNERIKRYLNEFSNAKIIISIDSLKKETYELIRKNGNFDNVMKNIKELLEIKKLNSIAFCPMIQNVYELPDIVKFCEDNRLGLYLNTVMEPLGGKLKSIHENEVNNTQVWTGANNIVEYIVPSVNENLIPEFCLNTLPADEIKKIIKYLSGHNYNSKVYNDFIAYLNNLI